MFHVQDKLKSSQLIQTEESSLPEEETGSAPSIVAANLLSMIDKPSSISQIEKLEDESRSKPSAKLQQFLDTSPRTDAVETVLDKIPVTVQDKVL